MWKSHQFLTASIVTIHQNFVQPSKLHELHLNGIIAKTTEQYDMVIHMWHKLGPDAFCTAMWCQLCQVTAICIIQILANLQIYPYQLDRKKEITNADIPIISFRSFTIESASITYFCPSERTDMFFFSTVKYLAQYMQNLGHNSFIPKFKWTLKYWMVRLWI